MGPVKPKVEFGQVVHPFSFWSLIEAGLQTLVGLHNKTSLFCCKLWSSQFHWIDGYWQTEAVCLTLPTVAEQQQAAANAYHGLAPIFICCCELQWDQEYKSPLYSFHSFPTLTCRGIKGSSWVRVSTIFSNKQLLPQFMPPKSNRCFKHQ